MSVMPISWHEENIKNMGYCLCRELAALQNQQSMVDRLKRDLDAYRQQVERAKSLGKKCFDREKFNLKRGGQ